MERAGQGAQIFVTICFQTTAVKRGVTLTAATALHCQ